MDDELITVKDLARLMVVSEDRIYTLAREGIIPSVRLGRSLRFSRMAINQFIANGGKALPGGCKRKAI